MQLPQPQAMPVRKLTQTQPACPVLVNPPRTLSAPVRQCSVSISFHAATVASRLDRRLDAPRLPLTIDPHSFQRNPAVLPAPERLGEVKLRFKASFLNEQGALDSMSREKVRG